MFCVLLGKPPKIINENENINNVLDENKLNIKTGPFTNSEYENARKQIKENKATGPDGISPEVLKRCETNDIIIGFANKILINHEKPTQLAESHMLPIPKKGDLSLPSNHRGISLSSIATKVINRMILNRIRPKVDPHLRSTQNGFRPGRSTTAHVLALRRLIEGVKERNLKAILVFIDFKKAFDSIHGGKILKILRAYGLPEQLVSAIGILCKGTKAKVLSPDGETELFETLAGVLQGDTFASYIFTIMIDYDMRQAIGNDALDLGFKLDKKRSRRQNPDVITDLYFADVIVLVTEELEQAQDFLHRVQENATKIGLHLNSDKTEFMSFNQAQDSVLKTVNNENIKKVDNLKYLRAWIDDTANDVKVRKALAWKACNRLNKIWKSSLCKSLKLRTFLTLVESVLLYRSETWTLTKNLEKSIDGRLSLGF